MLSLLSIIEEGIPDHRHQLPPQLRDYHPLKEHLYRIDGVVMYKDQIVISPSLQCNCLLAFHAAHQGVSSMISGAETSIFGQALPPIFILPEIIVATVIKWHLHQLLYHLHRRSLQFIFFNVYVSTIYRGIPYSLDVHLMTMHSFSEINLLIWRQCNVDDGTDRYSTKMILLFEYGCETWS